MLLFLRRISGEREPPLIAQNQHSKYVSTCIYVNVSKPTIAEAQPFLRATKKCYHHGLHRTASAGAALTSKSPGNDGETPTAATATNGTATDTEAPANGTGDGTSNQATNHQ